MQVCVLDKRLIEGRTQEWNISRGELRVRMNLHACFNVIDAVTLAFLACLSHKYLSH